jgi:hypothetical protein
MHTIAGREDDDLPIMVGRNVGPGSHVSMAQASCSLAAFAPPYASNGE